MKYSSLQEKRALVDVQGLLYPSVVQRAKGQSYVALDDLWIYQALDTHWRRELERDLVRDTGISGTLDPAQKIYNLRHLFDQVDISATAAAPSITFSADNKANLITSIAPSNPRTMSSSLKKQFRALTGFSYAQLMAYGHQWSRYNSVYAFAIDATSLDRLIKVNDEHMIMGFREYPFSDKFISYAEHVRKELMNIAPPSVWFDAYRGDSK